MSYLRREHVMNELENNSPINLDYGIVGVVQIIGIVIFGITLFITDDPYIAMPISGVSILFFFWYYCYRLEKCQDTIRNMKTLIDKDIISIEKYNQLVEQSNGYLRKELIHKYIVVDDHEVDILMETERIQLKALLDNINKGIYDQSGINNVTLINYLKLNITNNNVGNIYWYSKKFDLLELVYFCGQYCSENINTLYFDLTQKQNVNKI